MALELGSMVPRSNWDHFPKSRLQLLLNCNHFNDESEDTVLSTDGTLNEATGRIPP